MKAPDVVARLLMQATLSLRDSIISLRQVVEDKERGLAEARRALDRAERDAEALSAFVGRELEIVE